MAIIVRTHHPHDLLDALKRAIDTGAIDGWTYDAEGDFTHAHEALDAHRAWLRPSVHHGELRFGVVGRRDVGLSRAAYGVYQGAFVGVLIAHVPDGITTVSVTAHRTEPDVHGPG